MSSFWESKYLSSEKSVQFLQQTHSEILAGLHEEICNLQQQCADYALRLSMRASTEVERDEFDAKFKSFNLEYVKKDMLLSEQQSLIGERNKNIKNLNDRIKQLEKRVESESNPKDQVIKTMKKDLEVKNAQIAHLTYQLHNAHKAHKPVKNTCIDPKESLTYIGNGHLQADVGGLSPGRRKKTIRVARSEDREEYVLENYAKGSNANLSERRGSSESIVMDSNDYTENSGFMLRGVPNSLKNFAHARLTTSMSSTNSATSDRSDTVHLNDLKSKLLPPVVKRSGDCGNSNTGSSHVPDPKPFLQSTSSTLHSRSRKELLQRRIALPQIKSFLDVGQLAVESPIKSMGGHQGQHLDHNNSSN